MDIRLIALDLDGTTMNSKNHLSDGNRQAIEGALAKGVDVVATSGRSFTALPDELMEIQGLRYAITSNGAHIHDLTRDEIIYSDYIDPEAIDLAVDLAQKENLMIEAFWNGQPYIDRELYEDIQENGCIYRRQEYVLSTRLPLDDIFQFIKVHRNEIENINFFFNDLTRREEMLPIIRAFPRSRITSSVKDNIELGGIHASKGETLQVLTEHLGLDRSQVMSFGDAPNDILMLKYAGFGVAVANAWDEVKAAADYIAESNDDDGVGRTIRKYVLK